jgi:hypothetical protein
MKPDPDNYPTVLIVAVNPLSRTSNNGKTIASLFKGYPKQSLAQLYFHREIPTSDVCENYYRISDEDLAYSIVHRNASFGAKVLPGDVAVKILPERTNSLLKKSRAIRLARSLAWCAVDLERGEVRKWLDAVDPDIIFFCGGDGNYLYNKVFKLSRLYNAKIIYYITDDYVLPIHTLNVFHAINRAWTRSVFKDMCRNSSLILTIGEKMSRVYGSRFGIESSSIMNLVDVGNVDIIPSLPSSAKMIFTYVGGLHSNRWRVLAGLGESLKRISERGFHGELRIYSQYQPEPAQLRRINVPPFSAYCGGLDSKEVQRVLHESDVLVHVEASDRKSRQITCLSISTKISEYMAATKPILAIGPKDVASIEYLQETGSGFLITSTAAEVIDKQLIEIFQNPQQGQRHAIQALSVARRNHDESLVRARLQRQIVALADSADSDCFEAPTDEPRRADQVGRRTQAEGDE